MSEPRHKQLRERLKKALSAHGVISAGLPTDIAREAQRVLGSDAVKRFFEDYYNGQEYDEGRSKLTHEEAERLVAEVEGLPRAAGAAPPAPAGKPAAASPTKATPQPGARAYVQTDVDEGVSFGAEEAKAEQQRQAAARIEAQKAEAARKLTEQAVERARLRKEQEERDRIRQLELEQKRKQEAEERERNRQAQEQKVRDELERVAREKERLRLEHEAQRELERIENEKKLQKLEEERAERNRIAAEKREAALKQQQERDNRAYQARKWIDLGDTSRAKGDFGGAVTCYQYALEWEPDSAEARQGIAAAQAASSAKEEEDRRQMRERQQSTRVDVEPQKEETKAPGDKKEPEGQVVALVAIAVVVGLIAPFIIPFVVTPGTSCGFGMTLGVLCLPMFWIGFVVEWFRWLGLYFFYAGVVFGSMASHFGEKCF